MSLTTMKVLPAMLAGLLGAIGSAAAVGCSSGQPSSETHAVGPTAPAAGVFIYESELGLFAEAAKLTPEQRVAIRKHLENDSLHRASLERTNRIDLIARLDEHTRTLVLSELRPEQAASYDRANLPGSKAFHSTSSR